MVPLLSTHRGLSSVRKAELTTVREGTLMTCLNPWMQLALKPLPLAF